MRRRRILVALDGSDASARVARFVNDFFDDPQAEVVALHVTEAFEATPVALAAPVGFWWAYPGVPPVDSGYVVSNQPNPARDREVQIDQRDADEERAKEIVERAGLESDRVEIEVGEPADAIRHVAEEEAVDLIVVGSNNRGWLDRLLTGGSVSVELAKSHPCPVLIV